MTALELALALNASPDGRVCRTRGCRGCKLPASEPPIVHSTSGLIKALLEARADANEPLSDGRLPVTACGSDAAVVELLSQHGADAGLALRAAFLGWRVDDARLLLTLASPSLAQRLWAVPASALAADVNSIGPTASTVCIRAALATMVRLLHAGQSRVARLRYGALVRGLACARPHALFGCHPLCELIAAFTVENGTTPLPKMNFGVNFVTP